MLARFEIPEDSKELYFKLSGALQICSYDNCSPTLKLAGIYAIFKNDVCYYVGQSQNLASRLSQHLTGKYKSADKVVVFPVVINGFSDFYERGKQSRRLILENNEFKFMEVFKPIENLITPGSDFEYNENGLFNCLDGEENLWSYEEIEIHIGQFDVDVTTGVGAFDLTGNAYSDHNKIIAKLAIDLGDEEMKKRGFY